MSLLNLKYDPDGIIEDLNGKQKIHVSRKVIVAALKQTTAALSILMKDTLSKDKLIRDLSESNENLTKLVRKMQSKMVVIDETMTKHEATLKDHDEVLGSGQIRQALDNIEIIKERQEVLDLKIQDAFETIEKTNSDLQSNIDENDKTMRDHLCEVNDSLDGLNRRVSFTEERWQLLGVDTDKGYRIRSSQVVYGEDKQSLRRVITSMREEMTDQIGGIEILLDEHKTMLKKFEPKVKMVPKIRDIARDNHNLLKSLGVGDGEGKSLLEQIQNLRSSVSSNARSLLEKADAKKITEVIETKYDEIVEHLQLAISSACDEEDEFKRVAEELRAVVKDLMMNKADRTDIQRMSERIAADKTIRDDVSMMKIQFADLMNRKEVHEMLESKLSRDEGIAVIDKHAKKLGRRINAMLASVMGVTQQIAESKTMKGAAVVGENIQSNESKHFGEDYSHSDIRSSDTKSPKASIRDRLVQGPGSASLGGGFRVVLPRDRKPEAKRLPNIFDD